MTTGRSAMAGQQQGSPAQVQGSKQTEAARSRLGMQLGDDYWLLDLSDVSEVVPVPELLEVPLTKPWFAGVANVRGNLVSVVDLCAFLGGASITPSERARLVLVADRHGINSGLLFHRVIGLRQFDQFTREVDAQHQSSWVEGYYRDREHQRWSALNMHALVTHPEFLQIELKFQ